MIAFVQTQVSNLVKGVMTPAATNPYTWAAGAVAVAVAAWIIL